MGSPRGVRASARGRQDHDAGFLTRLLSRADCRGSMLDRPATTVRRLGARAHEWRLSGMGSASDRTLARLPCEGRWTSSGHVRLTGELQMPAGPQNGDGLSRITRGQRPCGPRPRSRRGYAYQAPGGRKAAFFGGLHRVILLGRPLQHCLGLARILLGH